MSIENGLMDADDWTKDPLSSFVNQVETYSKLQLQSKGVL